MRLNKTLPPAPGKIRDPFPTRYGALEWWQNTRLEGRIADEPTASELYLANAIMGAQREVLRAYLDRESIPLDTMPGAGHLPGNTPPDNLLDYWVENLAALNPAMKKFQPLLEQEYCHPEAGEALKRWSDSQRPAFATGKSIFSFLSEPFETAPDQLFDQAEFILKTWRPWIGEWALRLVRALDYIQEERKVRFAGPGPVVGPDYHASWTENPERYSSDRDWMPSVVMIAKNTLVWLDQLSQKYARNISRLDDIPDTELRALSEAGFNTLWLIGLWERSTASKTIKQWCGNREAEASAYAIKRYVVAADLGGDEALERLKALCAHHGIRLASDMVPNHTALDSDWLMEHPDWFVSRPDNPFPNYTFSGENLSGHPRIGIYLEDHYFTRSDAAVVFKRVDHDSGQQQYIYHGNDGTAMPWNDTAQLNYLNRDLREAVMQTILKVARQFPVIRFDAAMTLARKHYRRLWFPAPGTGSDIPSRSDYALSEEEFDALLPDEFWREVVDRVATEAPDTLLLAEAFWLMEGYFVRTLGMHRVYNSAFMNMLKMERNGEYRKAIRETLAFDPDIIKRYVNFMSNPDEETARTQFGDDDKYFAVATLLATLPGLPLWGHGQTEGFREKYGMEFRRAYWDEYPDERLVNEHRRRIFPLFRQRYLFAEVSGFRFYDFHTSDGINENVFAYSNRSGNTRVLVFVNNALATTRGWIRESVPYRNKTANREESESLSAVLDLNNKQGQYLVYRDMIRNEAFIHPVSDLIRDGFSQRLEGYQSIVYSQFSLWSGSPEVQALCNRLQGQGVNSLEDELWLEKLRPAHDSFVQCLRAIQDNNQVTLKTSLSELLRQAKPAIRDRESHFREIWTRLAQYCDQVISRADEKPDWVGSPSTITALAVLAASLGAEHWPRLYQALRLPLALEYRLSLNPGLWEATRAALEYLQKRPLASLVVTIPEQEAFKTLFQYNEWNHTPYLNREAWDAFFSLCYWLNVSGWKEIHPLAALHEYRLEDIIADIKENHIHD